MRLNLLNLLMPLPLLIGCSPGRESDPPDLANIVPRSGQWEVESFRWESVCEGDGDKVSGIREAYVRKPEERLWITWGQYRHEYDYVRCPINENGNFACTPQLIHSESERSGDVMVVSGAETMTGTIVSEERMEVAVRSQFTCEPADNCITYFRWTTCDAVEVATLVWYEDP